MAKQTEIEEFEAVFNCYKNMVFKLAYLTVGNAQEAEDIMQEVFIKVYRAQGSFNSDKGNFNCWLRRITINQIISRRRRKSLSSLPLEVLEEEGTEFRGDPDSSPEELLIKQEEKKSIREAMRFLDRKHRAVLVLRYFDNLSYNEIAGVLEIPLGTVKSRINTAIKALRKELGERRVPDELR